MISIEPLFGTHKRTGEAIIVIALAGLDRQVAQGIYIEADGNMGYAPLRDLNVDIRYDRAKRAWVDASVDEDVE